MKKANIHDVAALAGVSIKTVSRVINKEPNVKQNTQEKVQQAIESLNYRPNTSARKLASQRSYLIALLYDDPSLYENPSSNYVINLQQGALRICKSETYDLLIHPCNYREKGLKEEILAMIEHSRVDGFLLSPPLSDQTTLIKAIQHSGTPLALISPGNKKASALSVFTNDRQACAQMTEYLASLGHTRIAFITGDPQHKALEERRLGYEDGLKNAGLKVDKRLIKEGDNSFRCGEYWTQKLMESKNPPTAIFCCNDDMATGVLRAAHKMKIAIPEQLSVAGFDDIPLAAQIYPALTTIHQPVRSMADRALRMLMDSIRNRESDLHESNVIEASLIVRESTGKAPI